MADAPASELAASIKGEKRKFIRLFEHAFAREIELARYAAKHGVTDEVLWLLAHGPPGEPLES